jgi:hypothetical protein
MLNSYWLTIPFVLQMLFTAADEFWFHRRRGLPRWERIGHPLDTLTVILSLAWILFVAPIYRTGAVFLALAVFSCIFVTKDEPIHKRYCSAAEMWLHSILFMLHPIMLTSAGLLWPIIWNGTSELSPWIVRPSGFERAFLSLVCSVMVLFGLYQLVYWNLLWHPKKAAP